MVDLPGNELFSAYIDGELTAGEQADVERILAESPSARQLVEDLRSLSTSLQSLPAYQLDQDLADRVLRRAEREILSEPAEPLPRFHQVDSFPPSSPSWSRRLLRPRNFAWSAIAIAVALVLAVMDSDRTGNSARHLAEHPSSKVRIEPLERTVIEAVEERRPNRPEPQAIAAESPEGAGEAAGTAPPAPGPQRIAEETPAPDALLAAEQDDASSDSALPLLIYECRLAVGRNGAEALNQVLAQCGIEAVGGSENEIAIAAGVVELRLTPDQVADVLTCLHSSKDQFAEIAPMPTGRHAGPRIPSSVGPAAPQQESVAADGSGVKGAKTSDKITIEFRGQITVPSKSTPGAATGAERSGAKPSSPTKSLALKTSQANSAPYYRVRLVLTPAEETILEADAGPATPEAGEEEP